MAIDDKNEQKITSIKKRTKEAEAAGGTFAGDTTELILSALAAKLDGASPQPLYQQISGQIEEWIEDGRLQSGGQLPSERRMTELLKVSRRTVRAALSELIDQGYLSAAHGRGNFVLEPLSRRPRHFLALERFTASYWGGNPRHYDLIHDAEAAGGGYVHYKYARTLKDLRQVLAHPPPGYSGILIYRPQQEWIDELKGLSPQFLKSLPLPLLIGGRVLHGTGLNFVSPDHQAQAYLATKELIKLGHRRIGLVAGQVHVDFMNITCDGYRQAMEEAGLECYAEDLLFQDSIVDTEIEQAITAHLGRRRFSAVVVAGSRYTLPFERAFQRSGILIPDELSVYIITEKYMLDEAAMRWSAVVYPDRAVVSRCLQVLAELSLHRGPDLIQELVLPEQVKGATCRLYEGV